MKNYDTKFITKINIRGSSNIKLCVYCLNEISHFSEWQDNHKCNYYNCDCSGAKLERQIQILQTNLNRIVEKNKNEINLINYYNEVDKLKYKYDIKED